MLTHIGPRVDRYIVCRVLGVSQSRRLYVCTAAVPVPPPPLPPLQFPQCRFKAYYAQVRRQDPYGTKADKEVQAISLNVGMFMVLAEQYLHGFFLTQGGFFP